MILFIAFWCACAGNAQAAAWLMFRALDSQLVPEMLKMPRCCMSQNQCPRCLQAYDFTTDGNGQLVILHPVSKCLPPVFAYEKEDEEETVAWEKKCGECKKMFNPKKRANGTQVVCGPECRKARVTRKRAKSDAKRGKYWKLRVLKKLNLPTRECVECHKLFTISTKFSRKQIICSSECRAIRLARRTKESRAA